MRHRLALAVASVAALLALPEVSLAQSASPDTELRQEVVRKRMIVRPTPSPKAATEDAAQAAEEIRAAERREEIVREAAQPRRRRPDLDYDVSSGIQTRNLQRFLR
jgi:hypothetical protein